MRVHQQSKPKSLRSEDILNYPYVHGYFACMLHQCTMWIPYVTRGQKSLWNVLELEWQIYVSSHVGKPVSFGRATSALNRWAISSWSWMFLNRVCDSWQRRKQGLSMGLLRVSSTPTGQVANSKVPLPDFTTLQHSGVKPGFCARKALLCCWQHS